MIRRINKLPGSKNRFRIPKKGRIRFFLIIVFVIAAVRISESIFSSNPPSPPPEKQNSESLLSCMSKESEHATRIKLGKKLDFEDVKTLVNTFGIGRLSPKKVFINGKDTLHLSLSLDTALQSYAGRLLERYRPRYGAVAALDPVSGRVLCLASYTHEGEKYIGNDLYLKSIFPAASVFKTVTAAAAIEQANMNARSTIAHAGRNHTLYKFQLEKVLERQREFTLENAFAYSINPVFGRIALFSLEKGTLKDYGNRFGFNSTVPFELDNEINEMFSPDSDFAVAELASGFNQHTSISPLFGALIASAVSEDGFIPRPTLIDSVWSSKRNTTLYVRGREVWRKALNRSTANELKRIMAKVPVYGTARNSFRTLRRSTIYNVYEYGGKTGSVSKQGLGRVDWFVGFARHPHDKERRIALGVVTTHGAYWTVHSSYIASELMLDFIRAKEKEVEIVATAESDFKQRTSK